MNSELKNEYLKTRHEIEVKRELHIYSLVCNQAKIIPMKKQLNKKRKKDPSLFVSKKKHNPWGAFHKWRHVEVNVFVRQIQKTVNSFATIFLERNKGVNFFQTNNMFHLILDTNRWKFICN
jgi:hypothetical protein